MDAGTNDVTQLLNRWSSGDQRAFEELLPKVYEQLRRLAAAHVRAERTPQTLQPTALVHEAYLRMVQQKQVSFENRVRFFGAAAQVMRRVLCDSARRRKAVKRGQGAIHEALDGQEIAGPDLVALQDKAVTLDRLDDALGVLEKLDARKARIVELRYFAGLSIEEAGGVLGISTATVKRDWTIARAWLAKRLKDGEDPAGEESRP